LSDNEFPHADAAILYAQQVTQGEVVACTYVRLACQRFLDDLEAQEDEEFPYFFDPETAQHFTNFAEFMPHTKGHWAVGAPEDVKIKLEPWQSFIYCNLFGWLRKSDKLRRYRQAYIEVPRKNAKSTTAAIVGNYGLAADNEFGSEVYSGATTERQAWEVFRPAKLMAKRTPEFRDFFGVEVNAKNLHVMESGSRFEPIIGKPGDGSSPHVAIVDEYHEHATDELVTTMVSGMGARRQPLLFVITTAGSDIAGPCYAMRADVIKILEGQVDNPWTFGIIYTIDEGDDWTDPAILAKANPNIGVSVDREYLEAQQQEAISSPRKQNTFKTKHLNAWVHARSPWLNMHSWMQLADPELSIEDFQGEAAWCGVDMAAKKDLTSWVQVFRRMQDGEEHYFVFADHWLPEDAAADPNRPHYAEWVNGGHLRPTAGQILDQDAIEATIQEAAEHHVLADIGFDPWGAYSIMSSLQEGRNGRALTVTEVPQNVKHLSEPMKWIGAYVDAGRIHHNGDPVLAWCLSNVTIKPDANDNIFPRKERVEQKIDAAVALIIAFSRLLVAEEPTESVYASRGFLMLGADE